MMRQLIRQNIFHSNSSRSFAWGAVIFIVVISLLDLFGLFFNITLLKSLLVTWSPMKMITAGCFLASAGSLAIAVKFNDRSPLIFLSSALSILVFIAGAVTLIAFLADMRLGPATVVYHSQILNFFLSFENRMAIISAVLFILIGIVLWLISLNKEKSREYAHILVIPVMFAGYVVPVKYIIEIHDLNTLLNIPPALNTAVSFCLLGLAVLGFYPETRIMRVFTSSYAGSTMARRQLFGFLIIPIVIDWLRLTSERIHLFSSDMGVAFVAVAYTFFLLGIVWLSARSVNETDIHRRISEEKIRKNEQRLKYHFENSPLAIIEWDENFIVTLWSNEAERMFGRNASETIGKRIDSLNLIFEKDIPIVEKTIQRLLSGQEHTVISSNHNYTKSGEIIECFWYNSVLLDNDGHMTSVMSLVQDVTERSKAEAKLLKLNQTLIAIDKCSQAMVRLNDENSFLREVCHVIIEECIYSMVWIGYALEDDEKTVLPMVHHGFDNGYLESQQISWADTDRGRGPTGTAIRTGKAVTCRNMLTDPKFLPWRDQAVKRGYASSIALPLTTNGKTFGALTIYSKVPDSFLGEEIDSLTELANDVAYGITAIRWKIAQAKGEEQLKKYAENLKELNATKDKFFGIIAHDLKNPFTSILGASEILAANAEEFDLETVKKFSMLLHDAGKSGYAILENLLEWSRSQTGRLSYIPRKLNVSEVIEQDLRNMTLTAAQKEITLQMSVPKDLYMVADLNMTHTILRNLLNNALKFTHRNGLVNIYASKNDKNVIITIKDNGIGISEEDQKKLFRMDVKYSQIGTAEERGTGLGLLLCREFVEKQGGTIRVESIPGKGSSFQFTLPVFLPVPSQTASEINSVPPED